MKLLDLRVLRNDWFHAAQTRLFLVRKEQERKAHEARMNRHRSSLGWITNDPRT